MDKTAASKPELAAKPAGQPGHGPTILTAARAGINIMRLDFDVLFEVMQWTVDRRTMSRLMRTCRALHSKGIPSLLHSQVHVDNRRLHSFCLFMTADNSRCQYLRNVYFHLKEPCHASKDLDAILGIIQNASNLKSLRLTNEMLESDDRFPLAFAALQTVEDLVLDTYGKAAADMLGDLESPLRKADITFRAGEDKEELYPTDFMEALANACETLEEIVVSNVHWGASTYGLQFPEVVSLKIKNYDHVDGEGLMFAFPKLRKLHTEHACFDEDAERLVIDSLDDFQKIRDVSLETQARNGSSWDSLDELSGGLLFLYCLGITCPTRELKVLIDEPSRLHWLEVLLSPTKPKNLAISCDEMNAAQLKNVVSLLPTSVQELELFVCLEEHVKLTKRVNASIVNSMRSLVPQITHLDLTIEQDAPYMSFNNQKMVDFGTRIAEAIPTLRYIYIRMMAGLCLIKNEHSWTIERPEDGVVQLKSAERIALLSTSKKRIECEKSMWEEYGFE
ncbi:hypothetical protein BC835DRAFT_27820 [Cytidiella melzeri]|nr:hypothetical protein BC835DRAFT_27820 [Cytidiella melzeri]